jgi:hypothetical protein
MDSALVPINGQMDKENVVYIHNGVSLKTKSYHLQESGWNWRSFK